MPNETMMDKLVALCARRGIVFPAAEIYGGAAGFYDYGPVGVTLKNRIREFWRQEFILKMENVHEIESAIVLPRIVWEASGHVAGFTDVLVECKKCHLRLRADHLIQDKLNVVTEGKTLDELSAIINENNIKCPNCKGDLTSAQKFNLMFKTHVGATESSESEAFLRPETAQSMFLDFRRIQDAMRVKLPFGIAQMGRSYRNEISPRNFLFRLREFEHLEIEFFVHPDEKNDVPKELWDKVKDLEVLAHSIETQEKDAPPEKHKGYELFDKGIFTCKWLLYWTLASYKWLSRVGLDTNRLRLRQHMPNERAHYAADCWDIEFQYSFGWKELQGIADRTDYDLKRHAEFSGKTLDYHVVEENIKVVPHVIEPSSGLERIIMALLESSYFEETWHDEKNEKQERTIFKFNSYMAPFQVAVFPLMGKNPLVERAREVCALLKENNFWYVYDAKSSIGRRYRRVDEIGVPFAVTIDYQTLEDNTVTIRERDSMKQERHSIQKLVEHFKTHLKYT
jgi:glycyl-tRNA synthetase